MSSIKYRPEIDGLRAVAVIPVIFFHLGFSWMAGGYVGVDIFFVISGFLITLIILKEHDQDRFSFKEFWLRRVKRILPALLAMITGTIVCAKFILYPEDMKQLGKQVIAAMLSFSNFRFYKKTGDYWGEAAENMPLLHTWSLSVEEQFYFVFPLFIIILLKYRKNWIIPVLTVMISSSFLLFLYGCTYAPLFTFYLLPTRIWELGSGCLLAVIVYNRNSQYTEKSESHLSRFLSVVGVGLIILSVFFLSGTNSVSPWLIVPVTGTVLFLASSEHQDSFARRILSIPIVVYIGKMSYSLYLWHWPMIVLSKHYYIDGETIFSPSWILPTLFLVSMASYHWIEKPSRKVKKAYVPILASYAAVIILTLSIRGVLTPMEAPDNFIMPEEYEYNLTWLNDNYTICPANDKNLTSDQLHKIIDSRSKSGIIKNYGEANAPEVVILGDSHGAMWSKMIDDISASYKLSVAFYSCGATNPFFEIPIKKTKKGVLLTVDEKYKFDKMRYENLAKWKPKLVIIACRWAMHREENRSDDLMNYLRDLGCQVILVEQPPEIVMDDRKTATYLAYNQVLPESKETKYIPKRKTKEYKAGQMKVREIANRYENCEMLSIADLYNKDEGVIVLNGFDVLYQDDDHLTVEGSNFARKRFEDQISKYFPAPTPILTARSKDRKNK
jgi:peptidoglycan/LPS O-acetylase OafA/YrhL